MADPKMPSPEKQPDFYSFDDAMKVLFGYPKYGTPFEEEQRQLKQNEVKFKELVTNGKLTAWRRGDQMMFDPKDVDKLLSERDGDKDNAQTTEERLKKLFSVKSNPMGFFDAFVKSGVISREKMDEILDKYEKRGE